MKAYTTQADRLSGFRLPISPNRWGPTIWDTLHYVSLGYPETNPSEDVRQAAFEFLSALPFLLPCSICREHLAETYLFEMPLERRVFDSRQSLGEYIVALRDLVKRKHACPECPFSGPHTFPVDVEKRLLGKPLLLRNQCLEPVTLGFVILSLLIAVPFLSTLYFRCKKKYG